MNRTPPRHDPPLSERDIQAYADGLLSPERAAHLRDYLGKRPGEARRVAFYGRLNEQMQRSFGPADTPLPERSPARRWLRPLAGRWLAWRGSAARLRTLRTSMAVIFVAALAVLAASGWMAAAQISQQALNNAAVMALMQASGSGEAVAEPRDLAALEASAPNLSAVGMHPVNRRTLTLGPFAHATEYVYLNAEHQPIVLLTAAATAARAQPQWGAHRVGSLRLLEWTAHGQRWVLAGTADARGLMRAADALTVR
ncbi:anti-sigma factor [Paraburkholderia sp. DHOC27]|uniref:anti-sigma factor family protein n=1 Tax=Paraburkholderia sp. DHOC27 TaxID=2303330 RepID=UPI000E3D7E32|nr:transcriptional regulator [Paraburkholderia sp. DHOC27]RFU49566.1 transcriptional regulator [Paraburkholderia sp. DHOC27]